MLEFFGALVCKDFLKSGVFFSFWGSGWLAKPSGRYVANSIQKLYPLSLSHFFPSRSSLTPFAFARERRAQIIVLALPRFRYEAHHWLTINRTVSFQHTFMPLTPNARFRWARSCRRSIISNYSPGCNHTLFLVSGNRFSRFSSTTVGFPIKSTFRCRQLDNNRQSERPLPAQLALPHFFTPLPPRPWARE